MYMNKSKLDLSLNFLLITFLHEFFATFSTDSKSALKSTFFDTHDAFLKIIFFYIIVSLFTNFEVKRGRNA
jgi:hypothetical protein